MNSEVKIKEEFNANGFVVVENIFDHQEVEDLIIAITNANDQRPNFRKATTLFAIRQFLKELPETTQIILNKKLTSLLCQLFGEAYFIVKSIYFDKPAQSNWSVAYHQDLTISVKSKINIDGYGPWTVKQDQYAVQPPLYMLQNNFTVRIHLDETTEENGALKVIPKSHLNGICRPDKIDWTAEKEVNCCVGKGGIMLMNPLLMHSSGRTINNCRRRVIHIEFSKEQLAAGLEWAEFYKVKNTAATEA